MLLLQTIHMPHSRTGVTVHPQLCSTVCADGQATSVTAAALVITCPARYHILPFITNSTLGRRTPLSCCPALAALATSRSLAAATFCPSCEALHRHAAASSTTSYCLLPQHLCAQHSAAHAESSGDAGLDTRPYLLSHASISGSRVPPSCGSLCSDAQLRLCVLHAAHPRTSRLPHLAMSVGPGGRATCRGPAPTPTPPQAGWQQPPGHCQTGGGPVEGTRPQVGCVDIAEPVIRQLFESWAGLLAATASLPQQTPANTPQARWLLLTFKDNLTMTAWNTNCQ